MNVFSALPDDVDFMIGQHEVVAGRWPQTPNECLVVLTESGGVSDMMLYAMGLRDPAVLDKMVEEMANGNPIEAPAPGDPVTFDDLMSVDFRVVPAASFYEYDETYKVWTDRRSDQTWLKNTVAAGQTMKVVGIVKPLPGEVGLSTGLWYPASLVFHLMDQATKADIVVQQRTNPEVNVLSGKTFEEEAKRPSLSDFDFATMLNVDPEILGALFGGGLTGVDFSGMDFSGIDLTGMDLSGLDLSGIDLSQIGGGQMSLPAFDLIQFLAGINIEVSWSELLPLLSDTLAEYLTYALGNLPDPDPDNPDDPGTSLPTIDELLNGFIGWFSTSGAQDVFMERLGEVVNLEDLTDQVAKAFGAYMAQVMQSMLESMMSTLQTQLTVVMRGMTAAMQSMMTQAVGQIASLFSSLSFDPAALSDLFSFSMQPEQLTSLLMSMMSNQSNSLDSNLRQLGYADPANPSSIDIYPKDFASKQSILATLDSYNDRMRDSDQEDKVVTYTDYVGMMMNSVTSIVDTVSVVLTVFVSISLVVSSIMIGVITYISVLERRKEIGILRALGASKRDIGNVFNAETLIVGFIAGALGMLISLGLVTLANPIIYSLTDVPNLAQLPAGALVLIAVSMLLTFVSGLIPSSAASRKDPVEALRSE
jgi:ABC-type antimicrobial peptide transport system permease subunit